MTHDHQLTDVKDSDLHFKIDPVTRKITNESGKTVLMQRDHNSERFTFEIPKTIDGHDMSLCDIVEVHYLNTGRTSTEVNPGVYEVDDLQVNPDDNETLSFSWLVSGNATKYSGSLNFVIHFACSGEEKGAVKYSWDTDIHIGITINQTIQNSDVTVYEYADVLEKWRSELFGLKEDGLNEIEESVKNALEYATDEIEKITKDIIKILTEKGDATAAQSWAVGGTGTRVGEDTNNSWYWALEAAKEAGKAKEYSESIQNLEIKDTSNLLGTGVAATVALQDFLDEVAIWLTKKLTEKINRIHETIPVTFTAAGWEGEAAPYTQTVNVEGITEEDNPILVSLLDSEATPVDQAAYMKAYGIIGSGSGETTDGAVTFRVYKKPVTDITVGLTKLKG